MNIYITKEREEQLRRYSESNKVSMSSVIDKALREYLQRTVAVKAALKSAYVMEKKFENPFQSEESIEEEIKREKYEEPA